MVYHGTGELLVMILRRDWRSEGGAKAAIALNEKKGRQDGVQKRYGARC